MSVFRSVRNAIPGKIISRTLLEKAKKVQQDFCRECDGKGEITEDKVGSCDMCEGKRWVETQSTQANEIPAKICPRCDGEGICNFQTKKICHHCSGEKYFIAVVEVQRWEVIDLVTCETCNGDWEGFESQVEVCGKCDGEGIIFCPQFSYDEECKRCDGTGELGENIDCQACDHGIIQRKTIETETVPLG